MSTPRRTAAARLGAVAAGLAAILAPALTAAPAGAAVPGPDVVRNAATNKCLEVADWRTDNGAPVRQWTCHGGANQQWIRTGDHEYVNVHSGKCLDIPDYSRASGTQAVQWTCNRGLNQAWTETVVHHSGIHTLTNVHSGLVLDVPASDPADGVPVVQWVPNQGLNQVWI
ncbi:RICIN domain-containing protein [Kitasatospora sp. NPDC056327]|uniref:RICIN domain-containing protein n=1 Tax=Kitasatospora sp. NPDC056327 TaxID=3345785 RepID=UPI0035DC2B19